jgi:hypothetical protein
MGAESGATEVMTPVMVSLNLNWEEEYCHSHAEEHSCNEAKSTGLCLPTGANADVKNGLESLAVLFVRPHIGQSEHKA